MAEPVNPLTGKLKITEQGIIPARGGGGGASYSEGLKTSSPGGAYDPTQTGWVFKDVQAPHRLMEGKDWRRVTAATETGANVMDVELPIRSMYATQKMVNPDFAKTITKNSDLPFVIKKAGQYFVQDGHHRLVAEAESGKQTAKVRLLDLDNSTQTQFPLLDYAGGLAGGTP